MTGNEFDMVFDCQKVFKSIMNAMAKPGTVFKIEEQIKKIASDHKAVTAIAMTLMDNRTRFYITNCDELLTDIREKTMAVKSNAENADFLIAVDVENMMDCGTCLLDCAKVGTLPEPHKSATIIVCLDNFGGETLTLTGPGIDGEKVIGLPESGILWMKKRASKNYEFPCGVDILFCTDKGELMGIPRTVKTGGDLSWDM